MQEGDIKYYLGKVEVKVGKKLGTTPCRGYDEAINISYYAIEVVNSSEANSVPKYAFASELYDKPRS